MRRGGFGGIVEIAPVYREHIRNLQPAPEPEWTARHDEVRVDDVKCTATAELQSSPEAHRQIRGHRRHICDRELTPEEHGHSYDAHAVFDAICRQSERPGRQDGDVVPTS